MGLRNAWRVIPPLVVGLLLSAGPSEGMTVTAEGGAGAPKVVVEVDVFSGVPNPTWTLDADSSARLATFASQLTPAPHETAPSGAGLGFRGFVVRGLDLGLLSGSPGNATLRVRGDDVVATTGDRQTLFADPRRQMYTMLRNLALDHVPSEVASHLPPGGPQP